MVIFLLDTIFCWGQNNVTARGSAHTPCTFIVTNETVPRPPIDCEATMTTARDIIVTCEKGYNGGLPQVHIIINISINYKTRN